MNPDLLSRYTFSAWKNNSSETCPAFGVARVTGITVLDNNLTQVQATKPDTTFARTYIVNGPVPVEAGKTGDYFTSKEVIVVCDASAAFGEGWGPKPSQWTLAKNYPATASIIGEHSSSSKFYRANWSDINTLIGKLAGSLSQGSTATFNVWGGTSGSEAVITSLTVTVRDWLMKSGATAIASGKKGKAEFINGIFYLTQVECA